jgi:hypothetical protein
MRTVVEHLRDVDWIAIPTGKLSQIGSLSVEGGMPDQVSC